MLEQATVGDIPTNTTSRREYSVHSQKLFAF